MPDEKKQYIIQVPGEDHVAYWNEDKFKKNQAKLYDTYQDAQVTEISAANLDEINDGDNYRIEIPGEDHVAEWDGKKLSANKTKLLEAYPNANISKLRDVTADRNKDFVHQYEYAKDKVEDPALTESEKKQYVDFVNGFSSRYDKFKDQYGRDEAKPVPEIPEIEPITNFFEKAWQDTKAMGGNILKSISETSKITARNLFGPNTKDKDLAKEALDEIERRVAAGEDPFAATTVENWGDYGKLSKEDKKKFDRLAEIEQVIAARKGLDGNLESVRSQLAKEAEEDTPADVAGKIADDIIEENSRPAKGIAKLGGLAPMLATAGAGIGLAASGHPEAAKAFGQAAFAGFAASSAGGAMAEARKEGADDSETLAAGVTSAAIMYLIGKIPFSRFTSSASQTASNRVVQAAYKAMEDPSVASSVKMETDKLVKEAADALGLTAKKYVKDYLSHIGSSTASFAAMGGLEAVVPLIYSNPEEYPVLNQVAAGVASGARDGLIMGALMGGVTTGQEFLSRRNSIRKNGGAVAAAVDFGKSGETYEYNNETKSWDRVTVDSEPGWAEIVGMDKVPGAEREAGADWVYVRQNGHIYKAKPSAIVPETMTLFKPGAKEEAMAEEAYTSDGYNDGQNADSPMQRNALKIEGGYKKAKGEIESEGGEMSEATRLDIARANAVQEGRRDAARSEIVGKLDNQQFWKAYSNPDHSVTNVVDLVEFQDGSQGYVVSESEDGTTMAIITENGKRFVKYGDSQISKIERIDLDDYLDSVVSAQDLMDEQERMTQETAGNLVAIQERVQQEGVLNLGTEEAPILGTIVDINSDPKAGVTVQVEGEEQLRLISWNDVASALNMPLEAKTNEQIVTDRLDADARVKRYNGTIPAGLEISIPLYGEELPATYKFKEAEIGEDGDLIFNVTDVETGKDVQLTEEMVRKGNLEEVLKKLETPKEDVVAEESVAVAEQVAEDNTLRDFRGNEIPLKNDGSVNQTAFWNNDPEAWAKWNDANRQDGGANSRGYIAKAVKKLQTDAKAVEKQIAKELDFDKIENLEGQLASINSRIADLERIENNYANAEVAQAEAVQTPEEVPAPVAETTEAAPVAEATPEVQEEAVPQTPEQVLESRLAEAKTPEEKRQALEEYYALTTTDPTVVGTREDILQRMAELGLSERVIGQVRDQLNDKGELTEGFHIGSMVFIVADDIRDARRARLAHLHEHWHEINRQKGYHRTAADIPGVTTQYLLNVANKMAGITKGEGYSNYLNYPNPQQALADEVIALSMEVVAESTPENVDENLRDAGLDNQEIINFVKTIYNGERGNDQTLDSSGRDTLSGDNAQEGERQDGGDSASQPEGNLGEQGSGSEERSIQGAGEGGLDTTGNPEVTPTLSPFVKEGDKLTSYIDAPTGQKSPSAPDETMFSLKREEDSKDDEGKTVPGLRTLADGFLAKLADKPLTPEELAIGSDAIGEMVNYMMPYLDKVKDGKRYLPEEIFGKGWSTIFKNGSYGRTMENTLICMRTLAYNDFVNAVQEKVGRPLTPTESFLASQMLYDIATDPQCLYCYVALDRKAYNGFLKTYIEQRDAVLDKYKADDSIDKTYRLPAQAKSRKNRKALSADNQVNKLYLEYLDGRADTPSMRNRFNGWLDRIAEGTLIGMKDLTSPETRQKVAAKGASYASQIDDAEKYAQSASWAKKQEEYRAYNGELLSMPQKVVDLLNSEYGLRFYSFSEYSPAFIVENMQMVRDAALRGLVGLAYTKEIDFAKIFAPTGININISCYGREAEDGTVVMDTKQGADWGEAQALRERYGNVGCVFVATNDRMVEWAIHQPWVDVVIPFHIVRTGEDIAKFYDWTNYTAMEADKDVKGRSRDIMPTEHMNDKDTFLRLCEERGLKPRFADLILPSTGRSVTEDPDYMKLVNETRRSVNETVRIKPIFDTQEARRSFDEFVDKGGYYAGWFTEEGAFERGVEQVAADVEAGKTAKDVDYGRQDIKASAEKLAAMAGKKKRPRTHQGTPRRIGGDKITKAQQNVLNYLETGEFKSEREPLEVANATQKQPVSDAAQPVVTEEDVMFRLSKNNKATVESWLKKREDINDEQRAEVVDYIDKLDDAKTQLATAKWFANGTIRIPEDMKKVQQAISVAGKAKVDPLRYNSPMELLDAHADFKPSEERINPDEVSTLHRAAEYPEGIVVYDVDNTKESRENMRKIINTHFGEDASPWCLLQGDGKGNLTPDSARYWRHYNAYPKQVAFKDGKLLAFSANDRATRLWWDRKDESHYGIPITQKIEGDELGRSANFIIEDGQLVKEPGSHLFRGNRQNGVYEEWSTDGSTLLERTNYKNGEEDGLTEAWYPNGQMQRRTTMKNGNYVGRYEAWFDNGQKQVDMTLTEEGFNDGERKAWWKNGNPRSEGRFKNSKRVGEHKQWDEDGELQSIQFYSEDSDYLGFEEHGHWGLERKVTFLDDGGQEEQKFSRRGLTMSVERTNGKGRLNGLQEQNFIDGTPNVRANYSNGVLDGIREVYFTNGKLQLRGGYKNGMREGIHEMWDRDGSLVFRNEYHNDEKVRELPLDENVQFRLSNMQEMDQEFEAAYNNNDEDTAQRMVDEMAEAAGYTIRGYHGTTHDFTIFDRSRGNAEGNWGKGFYFTNNEDDANVNYAGEGPDLTNRIELLAENMEWMDGYEDMDYEQRLEEARKQLAGDNPHVISAAIKMENPVVFDSRGGQQETYFDYNENYNEETEEYEGEPTGRLVDFVEAWNDVLTDWEWEGNNVSPDEILEYANYEGLTATQLEDKAREILAYVENSEGQVATGEFLRQVFERMGFDGIVDNNVNQKFGSQRRYGRGMDGVDYGTTHVIAFQPNQIKQADPFTFDDEGKLIPLSKRFDSWNDDIRFRKAFDSVENELGEEQVSVDNPDLMNEYGLSNVTMTKKGDVVTLNKVVVTDQKKGNGTRFMQDFTQKADKEGWTLALTPDDSFGATSISRLKKFYKRFGFKENKGKNADLTINESMIRKPEEDVRFRKVEPIVDEKSEELFEQAKKTFGTTNNLSEAGYVIPDGSMLDFSGRHLLDPSQDSSWMNGMRQVDHREISDLNYEKDGNTPSGYETDMRDFIRRGAIRLNSGVINLATKPTKGQENVLWGLIQRANGDVDVDFGDGYDTDHYASYNHARPERILNDIRRYFDEGIEPEGNVMFRKANQTQNGFISNAQMALDKIKMDKATPEQWVKMLEKEGGMKAGEDKWLGLSDWLKESDKKTLTKDEIGDFIEQNRIQIEEQHYSEEAILGAERAASEALQRYQDEFDSFADEWRNGDVENSYYWASAPEYAFEQMVEKYGDDFRLAFEVDGHTLAPMQEYDDEFNDATKYFLGLDGAEVRPIDSVRLDYTTPGLSNKAEIALTVPTIDPWNEGDKIHFGDAGEGRAVAWIRFGDATSVEAGEQGEEQSNEKELTPEQRERLDSLEKRVREAGLSAQASTNQEELDLAEAALREAMAERDAYKEELGLNERPVRTAPQGRRSRVLVIDEIQSKRHQEGRESGYADATKIEALEQKMKEASQASVAYIETLKEKYDDLGWIDEMTDEEERRVRELDAARITTAEAFDKAKRGVPAAPFEKNWHELAMKRMLRLAAEEGYDKIAWTTGDQQAERYNLGGVVNKIESTPYKSEGYNVDIVLNKGDVLLFNTDKEGTILSDNSRDDQYVGKNLSDVVGKDIAKRILDSTEEQTISGDGLRVGGEGMNGFYDDILPRFMNKYGKKWGVKVQDVALSDVYDETGRPLVMHSVDVTPEMKESVMEGQTMFRKGQITPEQDKEYMDAVNAGDMEKAQQMVREAAALAMPDTKVVDEDGKPKVVYHGSYKKGITKFNDEHKWSDSPRGTYWFTNIKAHAETYQQDGGDLLNVFLNIKNPLIIDAEGMSWDQLPAYYEVYSDKDGVEIDEQFDTYAEALVFTKEKGISEKSIIAQGEMDTNAWAKRAKEKGYDGLIVKRVSDIYDTLGENVSREDEIADDYVVFAPNQIKSAEPVTYDDNGNVIPLSERFNEESDDIRFSLRGIIGAENAEDEAALDNLEVAEEMENAGKDSQTIWRATGWERGADGKWRNEIPDAKQKEGVSLQKHNIASEVLDAPELFASYPQLAEIPIDLANTVAAGAYNAEKNRIVLDTDYNTKESDGLRQLTKEGIRTILHELQHAIQHIEGFAKGTNAKQGERLYYRDALKSKPEETYFAWFFSRKNSARKLNQVGRSKVIRFAENYDQSNLTEQDKEYFRNLINYLKGISDDEFKKFVSRAAKVVKTAEKAGEKSYENSAGEVEARNAERRSRMSEEDRRRFSPEITEEVSRNEQEVRFRRSQELVSQSREGGLAGVIGDEDAAELYRNVYRAIPKEIRERIVDRAGDGFLFSEATQNAIAEAVEKGDETGIAGLAANMLRDYVGDLDERTARYILWRGDRKAEDDDLLDTVKDITMQRRLQVGQFAEQPMFRKSPITPEQDREYLDAVKSGDMERAQQMVNEAAKLSMPNTKVIDGDGNPLIVYHGTQHSDKNPDFFIFNLDRRMNGRTFGDGFYFTDSEELGEKWARRFTARGWSGTDEYEQLTPRVIPAFLNLENMVDATTVGLKTYRDLEYQIRTSRRAMRDNGIEDDGMVIRGIKDGYDIASDIYIAKRPNQIKSAEPVTYDDNGNVIPLSERFNPDSEDIRFRLADNIEDAENRANSMADDAKATLDEKKEFAKVNDALTTIKAMSLQKEYDRKTVNTITVLAKNVLKDQSIETLSRHEIARLLGIITTSIGKAPKTVKKNADALVGLIVDHLLRSEETKLGMLANTKASKTNQAGVEVQGALDVRGQNVLKAYKAGLDMDLENPEDEFDGNTIKGRLNTLSDRLSSEDDAVRSEAEDEYAGLMLAQEYQEKIKASINEERGLKNEMKEAAEAYRDGNMSRTGYNQFVEEAEKSVRENKIERIEAYRDLRLKMLQMMEGSIDARKEFTEREKQRVEEIHHLANSDMQGEDASPFKEPTRMGRFANSSIVRFFSKPLITFDQMLRLFGQKNVAGEGYLFNKFHRGWIDATEKAYLGDKQAKEELDAKVSEVFDKKMRWSDLYEEERKMPTVKVKWWDGGEMKEHDLTQGNLLYIYMVNKMTDGRMKLRRMGITEETVDAIKRQMDSRFIELADWLQEEYLVNKRNKYNAVHERLFGASMAAIEDYFPLKINKRSLNRAEDIGRPEFDDALPATTTGSIIKRRRNAQDLDLLGADAFSVVIEHVEQMEQWAAFAEFNKDLNTLLSYKRFRNQVQNMTTVYGSGSELWRNFKAVCRVAGGTYNPAGKKSDLDTAALNIAKGVTAAKISFRVYTALKQFLSMPAFVSDANIKYLGENMATPWKAWNWAMENLPLFEKRWKSRQAGDTRLMKTESDWKLWRNKIVEKASQWGMSPNAFVDALTVSIGAHSIYQSRYDRYIKDGYTEAQADKKAKQDATTLYNETQQSNEAAFTSPVQLDRTVLATMLTVFRNSSMGYQRQLHDAIRNIGKMMKPGYKAASIEFMTKQMVRDGLTEEQAEHAANRNYEREKWRSAARVATFGFLVQFAWNLGGSIAYLLFGDDDDKKEEMLTEALIHGLIGGSMEGLAGGNVMSEALNMVAKGESLNNYDPSLLPIISDMKSAYKKMSYDPVAGANDLINLAIQAGIGVNPQTLTDAVVAVVDACGGDLDTSKEAMLLIMRVLQVPQSQVDEIYIDELGENAASAKRMSVSEMAERYARYKVNKGAPITGWAYSDEAEEKREKAYLKRFKKLVKERKSK